MWTIDRILKWGEETKEGEIRGNRHLVIGGYSINTQTLQSSEIFIALQGNRCDGHSFIQEAFQKGASGAMVSRAWFQASSMASDLLAHHFFILVDDPLIGLQSLAGWHRNQFSVPVIGITGSNGKTTTKEMLASILSRRGPVLKNEGNFNNGIGLPLTLLRLSSDHRLVVLEMGISQPGEMRRLCTIAKPTAGLITNIGPAHLEFLGDLSGVAMEKQVLFDSIPKNGAVIVNDDDPYLSKWTGDVLEKWTYAVHKGADLTAMDITQSAAGTTFTLQLDRHHSGGGGKQKIVLSLLGAHQVYNAMAASATALALGYEFDDIRDGLRQMRPIPLRGEVIHALGATIFLDAYNANAESIKSALQTLVSAFEGSSASLRTTGGFDSLANTSMESSSSLLGSGACLPVATCVRGLFATPRRGRKVAILGDMLELGETARKSHLEVGRMVVQNGIDRLIVVGKWSAFVAQGAKEKGMLKEAISIYKDIKEVNLALEIKEGDIVLIKGSRGMGMEQALSSFLKKDCADAV